MNTNGQPEKVLVMDNTSPLETGLRDYFVWAAGEDIVIVGNTVANSTREHIIRVNGMNRLNVSGNDLSNLRRVELGDRSDIAKGVVTNQSGTYSYIAENDLTGPSGIGPLNGADGVGTENRRFKHAVFESNVMRNDTFWVRHGAEHVTIRNNVLRFDGGTIFSIDGYSTQFGRGAKDVVYSNNTGHNASTRGRFLFVGGDVDGITLTSNLYVAPNFSPGVDAAAAVYVNDTDLRSFRTIANNVWPSGDNGIGWAQGGVNYLGTNWTNQNYRDPTEWNAMPQVQTDYFVDVNLANGAQRYSVGGVVAGSSLRT